jgi:RimJ/RimL family protein N-acetyltransferase
VLRPDYPILTASLLLRPLAEDDLDALHAVQSREDVARYLYWEPKTRENVRQTLRRRMVSTTLDEDNDYLELAAVRRDSGMLIGTGNLYWSSYEHQQGEIGFVLHPDHHHRGFGTEIALAMLALGFHGLGLHRITGRCDARNAGSAGVMARAGMRREAHLVQNEFNKGEWTDELVYAMLATEWTAQRGKA